MALTMSLRATALAAFGLIGGITFASAQCPNTSPNFSPDFSAVGAASCFQLNSANASYPASITNASMQASGSTVLQLTPSMGGLAASAWYTNPQPVSSGFTTTFSFQLGDSNTGTNADGIAFLIQNSQAGTSAIGSGGGGIGYAGISNSVAIEFNTFQNTGDLSNNEVTIQSCGASQNTTDSSCAIASRDLTGTGISLAGPLGQPSVVHTATVIYSVPATCSTSPCSTIDVMLDGVDLFPGGVPFDITTIGLANSSSAFVGFTGGTGADDDEQIVNSWTFASSQTQTGTVTPTQTNPTTFNYNGGFQNGNPPSNGFNFSAQQSPQTPSPQTVQMTVTAIPTGQAACSNLVAQTTAFKGAQCFVYQNGGGPGQDSSVMFAVTCTQPDGTQGSCGATTPFYADLGTQFSFTCFNLSGNPAENPGLTCPSTTTATSGGDFGLPHISSTNGLPAVGFLKGEGPDPSNPCNNVVFASNQIESFALGDTSGGAKGGSGGTTSCWVMTYLTPGVIPMAPKVTQPTSNGIYTQNENDATTKAIYANGCSAQYTGNPNSVPKGPYLTVSSCTATDAIGLNTPVAVADGAQFDTGTLGPHTFTTQVQDSAMNTNQTVVNYSVVAPPVISGASSAQFAVGTPNSVGFSATGYPTPTFTESGALPNGVTFVDNKNGTATLSGTASVSGIYNITITAQNGVLPNATLPFTLTSTSTVPTAGTKCNGVYNGNFKGNLTVTGGQTCIFIGGGVTGNVAQTGGTLMLTNATVTGNLQTLGGAFAVGPGTSIKGNMAVLNLGKSGAQNTICGAAIGGSLQVVASFTPIAIGNGTASCPGNSIGSSLTVSANDAAIAMYGNTIGGSLTDTANFQPTQVFSNNIKGSLTCTADVGITGGGNTAKVKTGQCSKF